MSLNSAPIETRLYSSTVRKHPVVLGRDARRRVFDRPAVTLQRCGGRSLRTLDAALHAGRHAPPLALYVRVRQQIAREASALVSSNGHESRTASQPPDEVTTFDLGVPLADTVMAPDHRR